MVLSVRGILASGGCEIPGEWLERREALPINADIP
jgi:hypothetical protein